MTDFNDFVDSLPADTVGGSERIPVVDANVSKYQTPDLIKTYILAALTASAAITPTTGDALLVERAGAEGTFDLDALCDYIYAYLWTDPSEVTPAVSGDMLILDRAGTKYTVDVDQLVQFVNSENGTLAQQITALSAATMADSDEYVLNQGGTGKKVSFTNLAARVHAQFNSYLATLTSLLVGVDDTVYTYVVKGSTPYKMTLGSHRSYLEAEINLEDLQWATAATTPSLAGDKLLMERSGTITEVDIDTIVTYAATGLQAGVLDFSALASAAPNLADEFVVDDAGTPKSITLTALETKLWTDYGTYVTALPATGTTTATDKFYCLQGGIAKYVTPTELSTFFNVTTGDVSGPVATTEDNVPQWDSTTKLLKDGFSVVTEVRFSGSESDTSLATEQAVSEAVSDITNLDIDGATDIGAGVVDTDLIIVDDGAGGTNRKCALSRIKTYIGDTTDITNLDIDGGTDIGAALADADLFIVDDGGAGTNRKCAASRIKTYLSATVFADLDIDGATDIGAPLADADLFIVDDGASGTNRKSALSRLKTYLATAPDVAEVYVSSAAATAGITATVYLNALANSGIADAGNTSTNFTVDNTNKRIVYTGTDTILFKVTACVSMTSTQSTEIVRFRLAENGTTDANTEIERKIGTGADAGALAVQGIFSLATNDYIELWATLDTSTADTITVTKCNFLIVPV